MEALQNFFAEEDGWMHLTAIIGCFLIAVCFHLYEKWKNHG